MFQIHKGQQVNISDHLNRFCSKFRIYQIWVNNLNNWKSGLVNSWKKVQLDFFIEWKGRHSKVFQTFWYAILNNSRPNLIHPCWVIIKSSGNVVHKSSQNRNMRHQTATKSVIFVVQTVSKLKIAIQSKANLSKILLTFKKWSLWLRQRNFWLGFAFVHSMRIQIKAKNCFASHSVSYSSEINWLHSLAVWPSFWSMCQLIWKCVCMHYFSLPPKWVSCIWL